MAAPHPDEQAIFEVARKIVAREPREAYLQQACGADAALDLRVRALLKASEESASFLESPPSPLVTTVDEPMGERPGTMIGPYKLLEQIGEGGFGIVFMAEQTQPVRRKVALKILKPGMDTRQVVARFEAERQALAIMDHPHIAKVHDGGATPAGRPFFVMELVKGIPITEFCDQHRLTPRQRLELFVPVCQAVQHAHQKGIIHRDLKPSNVLVSRHDTTPVVKIIDFGVAKALGQELTDKTLFTGIAQMIGTPLYMSPEQAGMSDLDIDTRSDIYSLGVLLYELLTGTTPFTREHFKQAGYDEIRRIIREEEPLKPSTRLSQSKDSLPSISAQRQTEPAKLTRLVRGELDWIVMKALEKDRGRRYETASAFAVDVEHYLRDEPVSAGRPSTSYRLRKFVRRNRGAVTAVSVVFLTLVIGVIGTSFGLVRADRAADSERRARETAEERLTQIENANEILGSIFRDLNPQATRNEDKPLQAILGERLDQASAQLEGEVIGAPLAVARMQMVLGQSQLGLGHAEKGIRLFSKARATFTAQQGADDPDTLASMHWLALGYLDAGKRDLAVSLAEETIERRKATLGPNHRDTLLSMDLLALAYRNAGKLKLAMPLLQETIKLMNATLGPGDLDTLRSMNNLALAYQQLGEDKLALPLFEETLKGRKAKLPPDHADVLGSLNNLALGYAGVGNPDRTVPLFEELLKLMKAKLGRDHLATVKVMSNLGMAYRAVDKLELALPLLEDSLKWRRMNLPANHPDTLESINNLALSYQDAGKLELALPLYKETLNRRREEFGPEAPATIQSMNNLAWGYQAANKHDLAVPLLEDSLKVIRANFPPGHAGRFMVMDNLGRSYIELGQSGSAEPLLRECLADRETKTPDAWRTFNTKSLLGAALLGQKKYGEAEPLLLAGYEGLKRREPSIPLYSKVRLIEALERLVRFYEATANETKAREWQKKLTEAKSAAKPLAK
jgi:serine/threonine protein kinase